MAMIKMRRINRTIYLKRSVISSGNINKIKGLSLIQAGFFNQNSDGRRGEVVNGEIGGLTGVVFSLLDMAGWGLMVFCV